MPTQHIKEDSGHQSPSGPYPPVPVTESSWIAQAQDILPFPQLLFSWLTQQFWVYSLRSHVLSCLLVPTLTLSSSLHFPHLSPLMAQFSPVSSLLSTVTSTVPWNVISLCFIQYKLAGPQASNGSALHCTTHLGQFWGLCRLLGPDIQV